MRLYPLRFVTFLQSSGPSWNTSVAKIELGPGRSTEYGTSSGSPTGSRRVQSLNTYGRPPLRRFRTAAPLKRIPIRVPYMSYCAPALRRFRTAAPLKPHVSWRSGLTSASGGALRRFRTAAPLKRQLRHAEPFELYSLRRFRTAAPLKRRVRYWGMAPSETPSAVFGARTGKLKP